ncbi:MAG TPA: prepilin-type N-terminal cleavage/methylation domain-containing protein [Thermoanaerobaculia bacterium]|nr:prepilin-type N-terminal cleavage/methylation domain-containing protein [Thermoanaerobaculia bacterium]
MRRGNSRRGFSLVELLVALAILLIGLALAAEIGMRARAILARSVRDALRPPIAAVLARLRTDVQGADRFTPPGFAVPSGWTEEPLVLQSARGTVIYRKESRSLDRVVLDDAGRETAILPLVRDGAAWRWRPVDVGLVEISIAYLAEPGAPGAVGKAVRRETLRLALRGAPGRWGW